MDDSTNFDDLITFYEQDGRSKPQDKSTQQQLPSSCIICGDKATGKSLNLLC